MADDKEILKDYHSASIEQPPAQLDAAIMSHAEQAAAATQRRTLRSSRKTMHWYATAATVIIGIGLVTLMEREVSQEIQFSPPLSLDSQPQKDTEIVLEQDVTRLESTSPPAISSSEPLVFEKKPLKTEAARVQSAPQNRVEPPAPAEEAAIVLDEMEMAGESNRVRKKQTNSFALSEKSKSASQDADFDQVFQSSKTASIRPPLHCDSANITSVAQYWKFYFDERIESESNTDQGRCIRLVDNQQLLVSGNPETSRNAKAQALRHHLAQQVQRLDDPNTEVRQFALNELRRYTDQVFTELSAWRDWWQRHENDLVLSASGNKLVRSER